MKFLIAAMLVTLASGRSYFGDKVFRLHPQEEKHFQLLEFLEDQSEMVEFWKPMTVKGLRTSIPVDVHIPRKNFQHVSRLIKNSGIQFQVMIENMQELIDNQFDSPARNTTGNDSFSYSAYHTYTEIMQWVTDMATAYPEVVQVDSLATSFLGREVPYMILGSDAGLASSRKIMISCGENAREWISTSACQCIVGKLATAYGWEEKPTEMLDRATFIVVPLLNVDGYEYSWEVDRNWVKTRSDYQNNVCLGVNTNANFDVNYAGPGTSTESCRENYRGPNSESEPEVAGLSALIRVWEPNNFISFQSYGQRILYPYFFNRDSPDNQQNLIDTAETMSRRMLIPSQHLYEVLAGHADGVLKSGRSADYASVIADDYLAYQIELPDKGEYGYFLPESEILHACDDAMVAVEVAFEELLPPV